MADFLFQISRSKTESLQTQIREVLVKAILAGHLPENEAVPSTREMAKNLGVSRNTILQVYLGLVDDNYLVAKNRSGYVVSSGILLGQLDDSQGKPYDPDEGIKWDQRLKIKPSLQENISKPHAWHSYQYPFIYGQIDIKHFPMAQWRECQRQALGKKWLNVWTEDYRDQDDPLLVEQIRTRLLPRRGIMARPEEILVTLGAQNGLYLLANLLVNKETRIGFEEPGYLDARNIISYRTDNIKALEVDDEGLVIDQQLDDCDLLFVTPSHQFPTTVTLAQERRAKLIEKAQDKNIIIIEDDYEFESNYVSEPTPALKSQDEFGNVLYIGSLSKTLFPGLRLGYLVAPAPIIAEARALRRLMVRHVPSNNQRTTALFLSLGHHDSLQRRLNKVYKRRWKTMGEALQHHLPNSSRRPSFGGSSYWVTGPQWLDSQKLADTAQQHGVILEPGNVFFSEKNRVNNCFRLGFSSIEESRIEPGIAIISRLIDEQSTA